MIDGGFGDADGIDNGVIIDPSGLGVPATATGSTSSSTDSSDGSSSACFISTLNNSSSSAWPESILKKVRGIELAMMLLGPILFLCIRKIRARKKSE